MLIFELSFSHLLCSFIASTPTPSLSTPVARCATEFMENWVAKIHFTDFFLLKIHLFFVAKSGGFLLIRLKP